MQLSKREIQMLLKLIEQEKSITAKELADMFRVSVRTVKYDLDNIRYWLKLRNIELHSQRNKGFWFELSDVQKLTLKNELLETDRFDIYADQQARVEFIVMNLLLAEKMKTTAWFASQLEVTQNTIVSDLEKVDSFLNKFTVTLERQSGQGIFLNGREKDCRLLMEYLLQLKLTEYDIYKIMNSFLNPLAEESQSLSLGKGTDFHDIYQHVVRMMSQVLDPDLLNQFNYAELLSISIRTAIAVCRLRLNHSIASFKLIQRQETLIKNRDIPFLLMQAVFSQYELPLFEDEYEFISSNLIEESDQQDTLQLTVKLIQDVSDELNVPFYEDHQLLTNLFAHLSLRLGKKHVFINEYNPFVEDIQNLHEELFTAITKACQQEIATFAHVMNDSFIAYIALHFLVSFEKQKKEMIQVVYVCSTGLGVTNLIQQRVQEEVHSVNIIGFASVLNAVEMIQEKKPDLVISIFPIEGVQCPLIKVNAIPSKEDIETIKTVVQHLLAKDNRRLNYSKPYRREQRLENSEELSRETIVKGYIIYEKLVTIFDQRLKKEYQDAFLLHVFLMVHRIVFQSQYHLEGNVNQEMLFENNQLLLEVEQVFSENDLSVNHAELTALLQYVDIYTGGYDEG